MYYGKIMNKDKKKVSFITFLYMFLVVLTFLSVLDISVFSYYSNISIYVNLLFVIFAYLLYGEINSREFVFILFFCVYSLVTVVLTNGGIGSVVTIIVPLLMLSIFSNIKISKTLKKLLVLISIIMLLILFLISFIYHENYIQYSLISINPNTMGMFVMFSFMILCVCDVFRKKVYKIFLFIIFVLTIWSMYNYESRGTTVATCLFFVLIIIPKRFYTRKKYLFFTFLLVLLGTAFPFVYLHLYKTGVQLEVFGKPLYTGRESIWGNMFELMQDDIFKMLFGMGSETVLWDHELNVHNNFFNIIVNFGVVGFILYYLFIFLQIGKATIFIRNSEVKNSLNMFVCSVIVLGFSETTSLWPVIYPFAYFGLIFANSIVKEQKFCMN